MNRKFLSMSLCIALIILCITPVLVIANADTNVVPKYAVLILDTSSSMSTEFTNTDKKDTDTSSNTNDTDTKTKFTRLDSEKLAAKAFCEDFLKEKDNKVAIISYNNDASVLCSFTDDTTTLNKKIDSIKANGSVNLNAALTKAKTEFDKETKDIKDNISKNIIIIADGTPSSGTKVDKYAYTKTDTEDYKFANAVNKLVKESFKDTEVFTIGLNDSYTELNKTTKDTDTDNTDTEDSDTDTLYKSYKFVKKFLMDISTNKDNSKLVGTNKEFINASKAVAETINNPKKSDPDTDKETEDTASKVTDSDKTSDIESKPTESKVESKTESKVESKVESNVESKVESKPESKVESRIESRPTTRPETRSESENRTDSRVDSATSSNTSSSKNPTKRNVDDSVSSNSSGGSVKARTDGSNPSTDSSKKSSDSSGSTSGSKSDGKSVTTGDITKRAIIALSIILVLAGTIVVITNTKKDSSDE